MFILNKGHQPGVYMPLRALFLVISKPSRDFVWSFLQRIFSKITAFKNGKHFPNLYMVFYSPNLCHFGPTLGRGKQALKRI